MTTSTKEGTRAIALAKAMQTYGCAELADLPPEGWATALDTVTTTEMEQYSRMRAKLNMTNKEFFTYLWMRAVDHNKLSRKVLEVPVPSAIREGVAHAS